MNRMISHGLANMRADNRDDAHGCLWCARGEMMESRAMKCMIANGLANMRADSRDDRYAIYISCKSFRYALACPSLLALRLASRSQPLGPSVSSLWATKRVRGVPRCRVMAMMMTTIIMMMMGDDDNDNDDDVF